MRRRPAVLDRHQRLGAGSDDRKVQSAIGIGHIEQIHVRAGVGHPQHPVHVERIGLGIHLEPLRRHHLKRLAGLDVTDELVDDRAVLLDGALGAVQRLGPAERRHRRRKVLAKRGSHHVKSGDGVVICPVDAFVGAVPVHRVGDERDGPLVVIHRGDVGRQQQQHVGQPQVVDGQLGQPLQAPAPCRRRRIRPGRPTAAAGPAQLGLQQLQRRVQRLQRIATARRVLRRRTQPHRLAVLDRQRRRGARPDERPSRPRAAVFGRLQQERPGPVGGQLAVRRQRGLTVGEHLAGHRHHAVPGGQRPEVLARRGAGAVGRALGELAVVCT